MGTGRRRLRQAFRFHRWPGRESTAPWLLVWIPRCTRIPAITARAPEAGGASDTRCAGTILTRTDSGGETLSTWRLGSAYGAAFLSNQWYPDRLNTVRLGVLQGSMTLGFDLVGNLGAEFWPDIKRKVLRRK